MDEWMVWGMESFSSCLSFNPLLLGLSTHNLFSRQINPQTSPVLLFPQVFICCHLYQEHLHAILATLAVSLLDQRVKSGFRLHSVSSARSFSKGRGAPLSLHASRLVEMLPAAVSWWSLSPCLPLCCRFSSQRWHSADAVKWIQKLTD